VGCSLMLAALAGGLSGCGGGSDEDVASPVAGSQAIDGTSRIQAAAAGDYYVDASAGSDTNSGSQAAPWKTLARISKAGLSTGQAVFLRCGAVWRESLSLGATQFADSISFGSYGAECVTSKPRILGSDNFSGGWAKSGNIWSRKVPAGTPKIGRLFINGAAQRLAQWPNHSAAGGFAVADASTAASNTQFKIKAADAALLAGKDIVGAIALLRSVAWSVDSSNISSFSSSTNVVGLGTATVYATGSTTEYVLADKKWMVDAPGEFFHDTATNTVYVYPADATSQASLNTTQVEGSVRDVAVALSGRKGLRISGIAIEMARLDGLALSDTPESSVSGVEVRGHGRNGVQVALRAAPVGTARGLDLRNSLISDNGANGINATSAMRVDVIGNTVLETGTQAMAGNSLGAILVGPESSVENNFIQNSAYLGIRFSGTGGSRVAGNRIAGHCARLTDCAGIYTWNGPKASRVTSNQSALVTGNLIQDTVARRSSAISGGSLVAGIYLDDFSLGTTVRDNTVSGGQYGVYVHNGSNHVIESNKLWLNTASAIWSNMDQTDADYMTGNAVIGNEIVRLSNATGSYPALPMVNSPQAFIFRNLYSGTATLTNGSNSFALNRVLMLNADGARFARVTTAKSDAYLDPAAWRNLNAGETIVPAKPRYVTHRPVMGAELITNGGFANALNSWNAWFVPPGTGRVFAASASTPGCTGTCLLFTNTNMADYVSSSAATLTAGKMYQVSFDAMYLANGNIAPPFVGSATQPFVSYVKMPGMVSSSSMVGQKGEVGRFTGNFVASTSAQAVTMLRASPAKMSVAFDNVSLREILSYKLAPASEFVAVAAAGTVDRSFDCSALGWPAGCAVTDTMDNAVALPVVVPARTAKLLLRAGSAWSN